MQLKDVRAHTDLGDIVKFWRCIIHRAMLHDATKRIPAHVKCTELGVPKGRGRGSAHTGSLLQTMGAGRRSFGQNESKRIKQRIHARGGIEEDERERGRGMEIKEEEREECGKEREGERMCGPGHN